MHSSRILLLTLLALPGCMGTFAETPDDTPPELQDDPPAFVCPVDPDCAIGGDCSLYVCPEYWICEDLANGEKRCTNPGPEYPDGGEWECEDEGGTTICRGRDFPDDGGGSEWRCESQGDLVVCTDDTPSYPDEGGGGPYNCWFDEFRICETIPGDGGGWSCYENTAGVNECRNDNPDYPDDGEWDCWDEAGATVCRRPGGDVPDGGGGSEWNCETQGEFVVCSDDTPDYPDDGGGTPWDCHFGDEFRVCTPPDGGDGECVPGVQRWCDDAVYCSWGKQTCRPDGTWGACIEPLVTETGIHDRPDTACGCRYFYFNDECCEDQEDRDGNGAPDCLIPSEHAVPACETDGQLCSYCDVHGDCGGDNDLCLFGSGGYAMCAQDCSTTPCPSGYTCQEIGTSTGTLHQCVPPTGRCE